MTNTSPRPLGFLDVASLRGPVAVCDVDGAFEWVSEECRELWACLFPREPMPERVPAALWRELEALVAGRAVEWRPLTGASTVLELSRFGTGQRWLLLLREVAVQQASLAKQLHRQRLEVTGRLVASIAHELRNSVASIVYGTDLLQLHESLPKADLEDSVREIMEASRRLRATVDGLLDYARLGPSVSVPVSLREVLTRAQGFLGPYFRSGSHRLRVTIPPESEWVQGNSIVVEQIFVNLLLNAAEASSRPITVQVSSSLTPLQHGARAMVNVTVSDDGPGVSEAIRDRVFEPFVTGREEGTGLGLTNTREAVESLGGTITLEDQRPGATFTVSLPRGFA